MVGLIRNMTHNARFMVRSVFLKEITKNGTKPMPPVLGDGQSPDLFKLFWIVRERGGYDSVSRNGLWASVVEDLGLDDTGIMTCLKLIYVKYLLELDQWFNEAEESLGKDQSACGANLGCALVEELESTGSLPATENADKMQIDAEKNYNDDTKQVCDDDDDKNNYDNHDHNNDGAIMSDSSVAKKDFSSSKRKRDSLLGMLNWVVEVAKHPNDPAIGTIPKGSELNECRRKEFLDQALWARDVLLLPRHVDSEAEQPSLQKKLRTHPSMYEDNNASNDQSAERVRCSKRLSTLTKSRLCPCCQPSPAGHNKLAITRKPEMGNIPKEANVGAASLLHPKNKGDSLTREKRIPVGSLFQADVPDWTGVVFESDPKWLGTRVWPVEDGEQDPQKELAVIGMGRREGCDCRLPGSVDCVRFHIAENRVKLKLELGVGFYHWRLHHMGEEISLRWTFEEEKRFKDMVRLNPPSLDKRFWNESCNYFPRKKGKILVSYYFNVFLVRRRSYQNRVTPSNIDSDDDESPFGSFGDSYGQEAVKVPGSKILICPQNMSYIDLE